VLAAGLVIGLQNTGMVLHWDRGEAIAPLLNLGLAPKYFSIQVQKRSVLWPSKYTKMRF